jgi:hypothetical protein
MLDALSDETYSLHQNTLHRISSPILADDHRNRPFHRWWKHDLAFLIIYASNKLERALRTLGLFLLSRRLAPQQALQTGPSADLLRVARRAADILSHSDISLTFLRWFSNSSRVYNGFRRKVFGGFPCHRYLIPCLPAAT